MDDTQPRIWAESQLLLKIDCNNTKIGIAKILVDILKKNQRLCDENQCQT